MPTSWNFNWKAYNFTPRKIDKILSTNADTTDDTGLYDLSFANISASLKLRFIRPTYTWYIY